MRSPAPRRWPTQTLIVLVAFGAGLGTRSVFVTTPKAVLVSAEVPTVLSVPAPPVEYADPEPDDDAVEADAEDGGVEEPVRPEAPIVVAPAALPNSAQDAGTVAAAAPKTITIPYEAREGLADRIIIPVRINDSLPARMVLDTGAPGTVLSFELAERLGLLRGDEGRLMTVTRGIGGRTAALTVLLDSVAIDDARAEFVPATVTQSISDAFDGLLGMDFLARYAVQLDTEHHLLMLTARPESHDEPAGHNEQWWRKTFMFFGQEKDRWNEVRARLGDYVARSESPPGTGLPEVIDALAFAEAQCREADLLDARLERFASQNGVPREWRRH